MNQGPLHTARTQFEISDANADIDGALSAVEDRLNIIVKLGSIESQSVEAENLRRAEIAILEQATEEILSGVISRESVQWVRSCLEDRAGHEALTWFPAAGPFVRPTSFESILIALERAAERAQKVDTSPQSLPDNPEVREVRAVLGENIAGAVVRPYDATTDTLSADDRALFRDFLSRRGMTVIPVTHEMDLRSLVDADERATGGATVARYNPPMAESVRRLIAEGVTEMYHATGLFTYEALKGTWITGTERINRNHGQFGAFYMASALDWDDGHRGLANYIQDDRFHEMCQAAELPLSDRAHELGSRGVLLKIDLRGYLDFLEASTTRGFSAPDTLVARAVCPPPAEFVRPVAVFEYPRSE